MTRIEIGDHLVVDTRVCGDRLVFKGTRVLVADALQLLKTGLMPTRLLGSIEDCDFRRKAGKSAFPLGMIDGKRKTGVTEQGGSICQA